MELVSDIGIGAAICGMMGWMMSVGARYRKAPARGFGMGVLFGLLMLVPMVALLPFYFWPETPGWVDNVWIVGTLFYEVSLWMTFVKYRAVATNSTKVEAKESTKIGYATMGFLKNDISPAA